MSPFALGLFLVMTSKGGPTGFLDFFAHYFQDIAVAKTMPFAERLSYGADALISTTRAVGPMAMMTDGMPDYAPQFKSVLLLGGPALAFLASLWPGARWQAAQIAAIGIAGLFALFLLFGDRAWLHHAAPALPLMYLGLAALADAIASPRRRGVGFALATLPFVALIWVNAIDRQHAELALEQTGGVKYYSDAINKFDLDAARTPRPTQAFLPDWGLVFSFTMLTGGEIYASTNFRPELARAALCSGSDALLGVMAKEPPERLADWVRATDWPAPETTVYRERSGAPSVIAVRWRADAKPENGCK